MSAPAIAPGRSGVRHPPLALLLGVATIALAGSMVLAIGVGAVSIAPGDVLGAIVRGLQGNPAVGPTDFIVQQLRVPRVLQAAFVGAGLACAGVIVQAIVANPIADPYVVGLSSGAGLGAVIAITTLGATFAGTLTLPAAAFAGAALTGVLVFLLARGAAGLQAAPLVLVGIAIGSLLGGVTSFLILRASAAETSRDVMFWLLGSLSGAQWRLVWVSAPLILLGVLALAASAHRLNVLALGDESASALGSRPGRARAWFFALAALLTGAAVSVSGAIGFVGLVVPNVGRLLVGADHRRLVPCAALLGALLLVWADTAARTVLAPTEVPIGILTAVVGVPAFVLAIRRQVVDPR